MAKGNSTGKLLISNTQEVGNKTGRVQVRSTSFLVIPLLTHLFQTDPITEQKTLWRNTLNLSCSIPPHASQDSCPYHYANVFGLFLRIANFLKIASMPKSLSPESLLRLKVNSAVNSCEKVKYFQYTTAEDEQYQGQWDKLGNRKE